MAVEKAFIDAIPLKSLATTLLNKSQISSNDLYTMVRNVEGLKSDANRWGSMYNSAMQSLGQLSGSYRRLLSQYEALVQEQGINGYSFWRTEPYSKEWSIYDTGTYTLKSHGLEGQSYLTQAYFALVNNIPEDFFKNCTNLKEVSMPYLNYILESNVFDGCISLSKIDFPQITAVSFPNFPFSQLTYCDLGAIPSSVPLSSIAINGSPFNSRLSYFRKVYGLNPTDTDFFYNVNGPIEIDCSRANHSEIKPLLTAFANKSISYLNCNFLAFSNISAGDCCVFDTLELNKSPLGTGDFTTSGTSVIVNNLGLNNSEWENSHSLSYAISINNLTLSCCPPEDNRLQVAFGGTIKLNSNHLELNNYSNSSAGLFGAATRGLTFDFSQLAEVPAFGASYFSATKVNTFGNSNTFLLPKSLSTNFINDKIWAKVLLKNSVQWI